MSREPDAGELKLRKGQAILVPSDTMIILPEDSRIRFVLLHYIKRQGSRIKHVKAPVDYRHSRG